MIAATDAEAWDQLTRDVSPPPEALRLNLGAGDTHVSGFTSLDRKDGKEAYPLDVADGSVAEILASHVLEHFSHRQIGTVLAHWIAKLAPGGKIRLAVPDFQKIAKAYVNEEPVNVQGYVMGGHDDANDHHGCIFDRDSLAELMMDCGLERIGPWVSEIGGASSLPISLNLEGYKPSSPVTELVGVRACMSVPRFGPLMHPRCAERAFMRLKIDGKSGQSCFWHMKLSNLMEDAIADPSCQFVLTMDFDTIFSADDVLELYRLLTACPDVDAVFPLQSKRNCDEALFSIPHSNPESVGMVTAVDLGRNLLAANTGHFGLTMFRAESLRRFPRPWMNAVPNASGRYDGGHTDPDIDFWIRFRAAGFKVCLAPRVVVGHLEEAVKWPGQDLKPIYQAASDYEDNGIPPGVRR